MFVAPSCPDKIRLRQSYVRFVGVYYVPRICSHAASLELQWAIRVFVVVFMSHLLSANQLCLVADSTPNQLEERGPLRVFGLTGRYSLSVTSWRLSSSVKSGSFPVLSGKIVERRCIFLRLFSSGRVVV